MREMTDKSKTCVDWEATELAYNCNDPVPVGANGEEAEDNPL